MDDFLEQMLFATPWGDGVGMNRGTWDATAVSSVNGMIIDSIGGIQGLSKMSSVPLMPSGHLVGALEKSTAPQEGNGSAHAGENTQYRNELTASSQFEHRDALFDSSRSHAQDISLPRLSEAGAGTSGPVVLQLNNSVSQPLSSGGGSSRGHPVLKNNGFEGPGYHPTSHNLQSSNLMAPAWRQPFIGNMPSALGQGQPDTLLLHDEGVTNEVQLGKRIRDDEDMLRENRLGNMMHIAQSQGLVQSGQCYREQPPLGQNPDGAAVNGGIKPRVRARRGQATDPHSIAERNRRERIAERMKALQELVPDANKTDKASMLDEIISYVKFLQMQVKCLSMFRLGGAGAAAPLFADLPTEGAGNFMAASLAQANGAAGPSQDGIAFAERQVARLMDEDMSAAMQYLQSKGLCLMPISLATAISSTGARQQATPVKDSDGQGLDEQSMELQGAASSGNNTPTVIAALASNGASATVNDNIAKSGSNMTRTIKDMLIDDDANDKISNASLGLPSSTMKGEPKNRD